MTRGETIRSSGAGTRKEGIPERNLEDDIRKFAVFLKEHYFDQIARDARAFKEKAVRLLRGEFPLKAGRPLSKTVTRAAEMRSRGEPWPLIYRECIPDYGKLVAGERAIATSRLRTAVRSRRYRREQSPAKFVTQNIPA